MLYIAWLLYFACGEVISDFCRLISTNSTVYRLKPPWCSTNIPAVAVPCESLSPTIATPPVVLRFIIIFKWNGFIISNIFARFLHRSYTDYISNYNINNWGLLSFDVSDKKNTLYQIKTPASTNQTPISTVPHKLLYSLILDYRKTVQDIEKHYYSSLRKSKFLVELVKFQIIQLN